MANAIDTNYFKISILTFSQGLVLERTIAYAELTTAQGLIGILQGHSNLVAPILEGSDLTAKETSLEHSRVLGKVMGGVLEVRSKNLKQTELRILCRDFVPI